MSCKDALVRVPASELAAFLKKWAGEFRPELLPLFEEQEEQLEKILDLGRSGNKPRKDLVYAEQIFEFIHISSTIISSSKESFRRTFPPKMHRRFCSGIWRLLITAMIRAHGFGKDPYDRL